MAAIMIYISARSVGKLIIGNKEITTLKSKEISTLYSKEFIFVKISSKYLCNQKIMLTFADKQIYINDNKF